MSGHINILSSTDLQVPADLESCFSALGFHAEHSNRSTLPFGENDITAGSESELQAVVIGSKEQVDLPHEIEFSRFYANLRQRTQSGETPEHSLTALDYCSGGAPHRSSAAGGDGNGRNRYCLCFWRRLGASRLHQFRLLLRQAGKALQQPGALLFLQLIWVLLFIYTGRSSVTGANLSFHIHRDRI